MVHSNAFKMKIRELSFCFWTEGLQVFSEKYENNKLLLEYDILQCDRKRNRSGFAWYIRKVLFFNIAIKMKNLFLTYFHQSGNQLLRESLTDAQT